MTYDIIFWMLCCNVVFTSDIVWIKITINIKLVFQIKLSPTIITEVQIFIYVLFISCNNHYYYYYFIVFYKL